MKKITVDLAPESFEVVCMNWERQMKEFIHSLTDGSISALGNVQWEYNKRRVQVYPPDEDGKKKRGAYGPSYRSKTELNRSAAAAVWKKFKQFSKEHGLNHIERLRNNEKWLGRYDFNAADDDDIISCRIDLPGEWNSAGISISVFIGPRYRNEDI